MELEDCVNFALESTTDGRKRNALMLLREYQIGRDRGEVEPKISGDLVAAFLRCLLTGQIPQAK